VFKRIREDIASIAARDPAARSKLEIFLCYPGMHAVLLHRLSHAAWRSRLFLPARMISQLGRILTGIEIHPGARIGERLFIDHAMGVVIGETAEIGNDVTLYQGVTLGGTSLMRGTKRHPTVGNDVVIGAGAKILGPLTIGDGARVGANAVVLSDVPAGVTVVGIPAKVAVPRERNQAACFAPYGVPPGEQLPDPVARAMNGVLEEVQGLRQRVEQLEREREERLDRGAPVLVESAPSNLSRDQPYVLSRRS
jgi:serine O-acetyltransferase